MAALTATGVGAAFNASVRITPQSARIKVQDSSAGQAGFQQNDPVTGQPYITGAMRGAVNTRHMPLLLDWEQ